jgi:hypothetical protein
MASYEIRADLAKNRLFIKMDGFFSDDETKQFAEKIIQEARRLKAPYDSISDLRGFKPATPQGFENLRAAAGEVVKLGARRAIRIESTTGVASMQFSRLSKSVG